ncbi:MAG: DUF819 family protein [Saprospiraceae bacterium]|nr:DUF819 family protein [Saprospiraceae bacterium]
MIWNIILVIIIFVFPFFGKWLARRKVLQNWLSPVVICYAIGIALGNFEPFPIDRELARTISEAAILFAIPLLLYSTNLVKWMRYANKTLISFTLCAISGFISAGMMTFLFQGKIPDVWKLSGMVAGLYTGGTPNMQAIGFALNTPEETIILMNAADIFTGGIYLIFLTSVAHRFFGIFLSDFHSGSTHESMTKEFFANQFSWYDSFKGITLTLGIIGFSLGLTWLIFGNLNQTIFILLMLTTLSVSASFVPNIRNWQGTYETGEYFLLAFCVAIGALANFRDIISEGQYIVAFLGCVLIGTVILHTLFARIFKIDRDTMMITSTAGIYGPAFIGQIATAIGNRELVFSGMAMGLLGYAIGNYWGIGLAYLLKFLM